VAVPPCADAGRLIRQDSPTPGVIGGLVPTLSTFSFHQRESVSMADHDDSVFTDEPEPEKTPERTRESERGTRRSAPAPAPVTDIPDDPDELRAQVRRLTEQLTKSNKDAGDRRRRLEELEDAERKREEARLTEDERVKRQLRDESQKRADAEARAAEATAKLRQVAIDRAVEREAQKLDFLEPDLVPRMVDLTGIDVDDEWHVTGAREAVKKLAGDRASLVKPKPTGGTPTRDQRGRNGRTTPPDDSDAVRKSLLVTNPGRYDSM
jgi:hypothetical protein